MKIWRLIGILPGLFVSASAYGQRAVQLQPQDAAQIVETSGLFALHYASKGCPIAITSSGDSPNEIGLRIEDACLGGVSAFAGDYFVDRLTGSVRDALDHQTVIKSSDPAVLQVWDDIEHSLLSEHDASCLISQTSELRKWRALGIPTTERIESGEGFFTVIVSPDKQAASVSEGTVYFRVNRRDYRVFRGRFKREDLSEPIVSLRRLLVDSRGPIELSAQSVLTYARELPEVASWLKAKPCRSLFLDHDLEGVTYFSLAGVTWCAGERPKTEIGFAIDKRSGRVLSPQGIDIRTQGLPGIELQLHDLAEQRLLQQKQFASLCGAR